MFRNFLWSWWRRLFFRKATPLTGGRRAAKRQARRLGVEFLEDRAVPAAATLANQAFLSTAYQSLLGRDVDPAGLSYWSRPIDCGHQPHCGRQRHSEQSGVSLRRGAEPLPDVPASQRQQQRPGVLERAEAGRCQLGADRSRHRRLRRVLPEGRRHVQQLRHATVSGCAPPCRRSQRTQLFPAVRHCATKHGGAFQVLPPARSPTTCKCNTITAPSSAPTAPAIPAACNTGSGKWNKASIPPPWSLASSARPPSPDKSMTS